MNTGTTLTHTAMLRAAFSYFGIDTEQMLIGSCIESQGPCIVLKAQIALTEDDVIGIAKRMAQLRAGVPDQRQPQAEDDNTEVQEIDLEALRAEYNAMSQVERGRFGSFGQFKAHVFDELARGTQGVGDRKVVHVEAPVEEADSGLPEAVWVPSREVSDAQVAMASDTDVARRGYLLQVSMLTEEQKAKYGVRS